MKDLEIGKEENGLYILYATTGLNTSNSAVVSTVNKGVADSAFETTLDGCLVAHVCNSNVWHARMGHVPANVLKLLPVVLQNQILDVCDSCHLAKQHKLVFPVNDHESTELFDLVHVDLWGPYQFKTHDNCNMFLTLVENKLRATWVYLLFDKSLVASLLKDFIVMIQNQFSTTIKVLHSDNGTEFMNNSVKSFLSSLGIVHQSSCVYTP